jgi:molecular chaperone DnaJ
VEKFKEISAAYEVLSDDKKRAQYDQFGTEGLSEDDFQSQGMSPEDILRHFGFDPFGFGRSNQPESVEVNMNLEFLEAVTGVEKEVTFTAPSTCEPCNGSGAAPGAKMERCRNCSGTGVETMTDGFLQIQRPCTKCHGHGKLPSKKCMSCGGEGVKTQRKTTRVKIPAGVEDGHSIRVVGQGPAGRRGSPAVSRGNPALAGGSGNMSVSKSGAVLSVLASTRATCSST